MFRSSSPTQDKYLHIYIQHSYLLVLGAASALQELLRVHPSAVHPQTTCSSSLLCVLSHACCLHSCNLLDKGSPDEPYLTRLCQNFILLTDVHCFAVTGLLSFNPRTNLGPLRIHTQADCSKGKIYVEMMMKINPCIFMY